MTLLYDYYSYMRPPGVAPTQTAPTQTAPSQPVAACTALVRLVSDEGPGPGGRPPLLQGECWIAS